MGKSIVNLITSVIKDIDPKKPLVMPIDISSNIREGHWIFWYVHSTKDVHLRLLEDFDTKKEKIFNVLLYVSSQKVMKVVTKPLRLLYETAPSEDIMMIWQTGLCDIITKKYEGCVWQGLVRTPFNYTGEFIEEVMMKVNVLEKEQLLKGILAKQVEFLDE